MRRYFQALEESRNDSEPENSKLYLFENDPARKPLVRLGLRTM